MREGKSIYIAGPMAGVEDLNAPAFARAAEKLSAEGWTVYDPVEIGELYGTAEEIQGDPELLAKVVKAELGFVARADAIYLLDGWERSVGAKRELLVALGCGLEIICETSMASHQDDCGIMKAKAFYAECQMKPTAAQGVFKLDASKVAERINGYPLGTVPPQCDQGILAFVDVNDDEGLRWEIGAFGAGRIVAILAYGRYPAEGNLIPDGTPLTAKPNFLKPAIRHVAKTIKSVRLQTASGPEAVRGICFDGGWLTEAVAQVCAELDGQDGVAVCWSKGFASSQYSRYHHEKAKVTEGLRAAEECHTWATANGQYLAFNTDYWKEASQSSFLAPPLSELSSSFYGDDKTAHFDFASEVAAEELQSKTEDRRYGSIWKWKVNGFNHYGDCHAGLMVFGAIRGNYERRLFGGTKQATNLSTTKESES